MALNGVNMFSMLSSDAQAQWAGTNAEFEFCHERCLQVASAIAASWGVALWPAYQIDPVTQCRTMHGGSNI